MDDIWEGFLGQETALHQLRALTQTPPDAPLLLTGPPGSGRRPAAQRLVRAWSEEPAIDFAYRQLVMDPNAPRDENDTRHGLPALLRQLSLRAVSRRAVLLDLHDSGIEVQNALLKALEAPPADTHFVLVGDESHLLPTIRSRCLEISFAPLTAPALSALAEREGWVVDASLVELAAGSAARLQWIAANPDAVRAARGGEVDALVAGLHALADGDAAMRRSWVEYVISLLPTPAQAREQALRMLDRGVRPEACLARALLC